MTMRRTRRVSTAQAMFLALAMISLAPTTPLVAQDDVSPFDALAAGDVRLSPPRRELHATAAASHPTAVGSGPGYRLDSLPTDVPLRVRFDMRDHVGAVFGPAAALVTETFRLTAEFGFQAALDAAGLEAAGRLYNLRAVGPEGTNTITLGASGATAQVSVLAETRIGVDVDVLLFGFGSEVDFESMDSSVANVSPSGLVTAESVGSTWIRVLSDGEAAQLLVVVDIALDSDGDGIADAWEVAFGLDPDDPTDADDDLDEDGLTNVEEFLLGTAPNDDDSDNDLLGDASEVNDVGTDPALNDTDGDGVLDGPEVFGGSDPLNPNESSPPFTPEFKVQVFESIAAVATSVTDHVYVLTTTGRLRTRQIVVPLYSVPLRNDQELSGDLRSAAADGEWLYVAAGGDGLHVFSLTDPSVPQFVETRDDLATAEAVVADRGTIYLLTTTQLRVLTRGAGGGLTELDSMSVSGGTRLAVSAPLVYVTRPSANRLLVVDASTPTSIVERQQFALPVAAGPLQDVAATDEFVYVAHGSAGLFAISAADPTDLQVIDTAAPERPGDPADVVAVRGNQLAWHTPNADTLALFYRIEPDGKITPAGSVAANDGGIEQLSFSQEYVVAAESSSFSAVQVLSSGDRAGVAPQGTLELDSERSAFLPGETFALTARASDDVYLERVEFFVDAELRRGDTLPPFTFQDQVALSALPGDVLFVSAVGIDLQGNVAGVGSFALLVDADSDGDGVPDTIDDDVDGDGIDDAEELIPGADGWISDPTKTDTDMDSIDDGEEVVPGSDGFVTDPGLADSDGDGLEDAYEIVSTMTNPELYDTDEDGVDDGSEDPDGDGLTNREEAELGTDPLVPDGDGDGLSDGLELAIGYQPLRADSDGDGVADGDEDADGDGIGNGVEVRLGTSVRDADSDGDGLGDAAEIAVGTNPARFTDFSRQRLELRDTTLALEGPLHVLALSLERSHVTLSDRLCAEVGELVLEVTETLELDDASRIDVSGCGFAACGTDLEAPWCEAKASIAVALPRGVDAPGATTAAGGSHGGPGGRGDSGAPQVAVAGGASDVQRDAFTLDLDSLPFDAFDAPAFPGGGGLPSASATEAFGRRGRGGGVVRIRAGEVHLDGVIAADGDGAPWSQGGGGAGGSVVLECERLSGSGRIVARGGDVVATDAGAPGGGGGGRVLIRCAEWSQFELRRVEARGGVLLEDPARSESVGGAGTIYVVPPGTEPGILVLDQGGDTASLLATHLDVDVTTERAEMFEPGAALTASRLLVVPPALEDQGPDESMVSAQPTLPPLVFERLYLRGNVNAVSRRPVVLLDADGPEELEAAE